jgi:hypothetical protein
MTYLQNILNVLEQEPKTVEEILDLLNLPSYKENHVILALKKGIDKGEIRKFITPNEKRLFKGHTYAKV